MLRQCASKLFVDEFATSLIPTDLAALLPDRHQAPDSEGYELVAVRSSANGNCLFNAISLLIKGFNFFFHVNLQLMLHIITAYKVTD